MNLFFENQFMISKIISGENMEGESHVYKAEDEDIDVSFGDEEDEAIKNFDDNVNSATCECS